MIENIEKYAQKKGISKQDALQTFMQVIVLKNLHFKDAKLIGGTALVMGHGNPRFSEDIDLTGVSDPLYLSTYVEKARKELEGLLTANVDVKPPKKGRNTWRITCQLEAGFSARLHIDSQPYPALSHFPLMVEYTNISPFVFPSIKLEEIMAEKLIALAFRRNLSGRDIFDLWYHWLKDGNLKEKDILQFIPQKLLSRSVKVEDFINLIHTRLESGVTKRVEDEWERYLPSGLKNKELYEQIFSAVRQYTSKIIL